MLQSIDPLLAVAATHSTDRGMLDTSDSGKSVVGALRRLMRWGCGMDDSQVLHWINQLADEEESLWSRGSEHGGLSSDEEARLHTLQVQLDQAYDLLAQRRARRSAGLDPEGARLRPAEIVENYQQ